jgi:hypothetical protein
MNGRWSSKLGQSFFYTTFSDFHSCILHGWKITVDFVLWCEHRLFIVCQTIIDNQVTLLCTGNMRFTLYLKREAAKLSKIFFMLYPQALLQATTSIAFCVPLFFSKGCCNKGNTRLSYNNSFKKLVQFRQTTKFSTSNSNSNIMTGIK